MVVGSNKKALTNKHIKSAAVRKADDDDGPVASR